MRKISDTFLKKIIEENGLYSSEAIKEFIFNNALSLSTDELSRVAEMSNGLQNDTAAYYTDPETVSIICKNLPRISSNHIRILEPSVGVGNILRQVIFYYKDCVDSIECDVYDINEHSLEICKIFIEKEFSNLNKLKVNYIHGDFLEYEIKHRYDLIVGNPPFIKIKGEYKKNLREKFSNAIADNISAFFLDRSIELAKNIVLIMPKYFLHNHDFIRSRDKVKNTNIKCIIDFGETGFKGVLIETICLCLNTESANTQGTIVISIPKKIQLMQKQSDITQSLFPNWLIYINESFIELANQLEFGIFKVFRDRQITSKMLSASGDIWVIKSKNIPRSGDRVIHIENDTFINQDLLVNLSVSKYLDRTDVYLSPNMTYYPRVVRKPAKCIVNGSVAVLELNKNMKLSEEDLLFFSSQDFEDFYRIARNYSTRSLNIDNIAIFYFGKRK